MISRHCLLKTVVQPSLLAAFIFGGSAAVRGAEHLETVRKAFNASSKGLVSGSGDGVYRYYESLNGGEWVLKSDADIMTHFDNKSYSIALTYHQDYRALISQRVVFDGRVVRTVRIRSIAEGNEEAIAVSKPRHGDGGLSLPEPVDFPWDVAKLASNVWDIERVIQNVTVGRIQIKESEEGDLVGTCPVVNSGQSYVRFNCPRRFGYNIASLEVCTLGEGRPAQEYHVEWKQTPDGLWWVRSLDSQFFDRDMKKRRRWAIKYTEFAPNAKVDPAVFTESFTRMPFRKSIIGNRTKTEKQSP
jgi:hypothetical protein